MQFLLDAWAWVQANKGVIGSTFASLYGAAEVIVRLTPTTKDDTVLERIGQYVGKLFDALGIPNNKAGGGVHAPIDLSTGKPVDPVADSSVKP